MIACLDVHYLDDLQQARAAAVVVHDWADSTATQEQVVMVQKVEPYQPGQFFRRELPCLLAVLKRLPTMDVAIVDGYVWLDGDNHLRQEPGLGAHLYEALGGRTMVVGVAKSSFRGATGAREITRGDSARPLYITSAGIALEAAAEHIRSMHGSNRIPSLLARVDRLCRNGMGNG